MKKCYLCKETKNSHEFYKDVSRKDGLSTKCKNCSKTFKAKDFRLKTEKTCSKCHNLFPIAAFDFNTVGDGYQTACKSCRRILKILSEYSISMEKYLDLISSHNGQCGICKDFAPLVVDHCHNSNKVRGLLCNNCNLGLGHFKDEVERLWAAARYLQPG